MLKQVNQRVLVLKSEMRLTDIDFCNKCGLSIGTLHRIKNDVEISNKMIVSISQGLNVSKEWLLTGEGEMFLSQVNEETLGMNPWKDALISELKGEVEFLRKLLLNVTGQSVANFNDAFGLAATLLESSSESVRVAA